MIEAYCATIPSSIFLSNAEISKGTPKTCDFMVNISFIVTSDPEIKKLLFEYISG